MTQLNPINLLVTPGAVDRLAHSIADKLGSAESIRDMAATENIQAQGTARRSRITVNVAGKAAMPKAVSTGVTLPGRKAANAVSGLSKGRGKRFRGQIKYGKLADAETLSRLKRVSAAKKAVLRRLIERRLENVHAAVVQALEQADVHVVSNGELELLDRLKRVRLRRSHDRIDTMFELLLDGYDPTAATVAKIDQQNAEERVRFVKTVAMMTSARMSEMSGHTAKNAAQTANRLKSKGKIFGVPFKGQNLYPIFQFVDGQPLQVVADILRVLPKGMTEWQVAFWFVSSNAWLDGKAPYHSLDDRAAVVEAARQEGSL